MYFENLEERMKYYRSLADYKLMPNGHIICMLDGRSFSKMIKNKFEKPFDEKFIEMMNKTAEYICKNIQGCKFGYVQSDEISLYITDTDSPFTDSFFKYRICKMLSIIASMATGKFNQLMTKYYMNNGVEDIEEIPLCEFDCRVWNVPSLNDVYAWFLYRQNDCIKNSKQQLCQTYLSHKQLVGIHTDEQIKLLKETNGIDWNELPKGQKYGRFIKRKEYEVRENILRRKWSYVEAEPLQELKEEFCAEIQV